MSRQPSSIDRLPEEIRAAIGKLRTQGRSIDEILAHLGTMDVEVSRSALGRHVKRLATLQERMRSSREMALIGPVGGGRAQRGVRGLISTPRCSRPGQRCAKVMSVETPPSR